MSASRFVSPSKVTYSETSWRPSSATSERGM